MIFPKILNAGCYTHAQKGNQKVLCYWVGLNVKGSVRGDLYYPDGSLCSSFDSSQMEEKAALSLSAPGFRSVFEYDSNRENWVIMFDFPSIYFCEKDHTFYWEYNGHSFPIPRRIELKNRELAELHHLFQELWQLHQSSLPKNLLDAELLLLEILHYFLRTPAQADDHVERFRKRIAEDVQWENSILEHCQQMGVNRDQLRKEFFQRYKISPGEYRIQLRLRKIRHLLAYSNLTLKEIAFETGMKNLSHLSSFVRSRCGKTPSALAREYRKSR